MPRHLGLSTGGGFGTPPGLPGAKQLNIVELSPTFVVSPVAVGDTSEESVIVCHLRVAFGATSKVGVAISTIVVRFSHLPY